LRIAIDTKNLALYSGGIAALLKSLLIPWIRAKPNFKFILVGPSFAMDDLVIYPNVEFKNVSWPTWIPRPLRHVVYDNAFFPNAIKKLNPQLLYTPYHDVRLPKGILTVMSIHDTCIGDLPGIYPAKIRFYYEFMLKLNMRTADLILTGTIASKSDVVRRYGCSDSVVKVIPNTLDFGLVSETHSHAMVKSKVTSASESLTLMYSGGSEYRKNIVRLMEAFQIVIQNGLKPTLKITGNYDAGWKACLKKFPASVTERVNFTGFLSLPELRNAYLESDVIVYPSLCEGFGRVILEAMMLGRPVACSNIAVLREVGGDYPEYFDPTDVDDIVRGINSASKTISKKPVMDTRFSNKSVADLFIDSMDSLIKEMV
jgi:glycosyltransferase involved in cell wall biosynthesis